MDHNLGFKASCVRVWKPSWIFRPKS